MNLVRQVLPSLLSTQFKYLTYPCVGGSRLLVTAFLHTGTKLEIDMVVNGICDALRNGNNWDFLDKKFDSIDFNNSLVEKILLELKEPTDAKRALGFFHWSAQRKSFVHGFQSYCLIIHILVRAGLRMDAQALLESLLRKVKNDTPKFLVVDSLLSGYEITVSSPFVFDLLVRVYAKLRMFEIGFDVCRYLEGHGFSCSLASFNTLIHVVQKSEKNILVWRIYEYMIHIRTYPNEATIKTMINALCKEGQLQMIVELLDRIHGRKCSPSVIVNTCLVCRILEEGRIEVGMALLKRMLLKNMILDTVAYSLIVSAKLKLGNLDSALQVYEEMLKRGFNTNSFVCTLFIGAYCKEGRIEEANRWFHDMENMGLKPYDETYNILIEGCAKVGRATEGLHHCEKMTEMGLIPRLSALNEMFRNLTESGYVKQANNMLTCLLDKGFLPDETTYSYLMAGYGKEKQTQEVLKLYYEMKYRLGAPGLLAFTSLISSLCCCGEVEQAEKYLRTMKDYSLNPNDEIYEALITCYFEKGNKMRANYLHNEMLSKGL